MIVNKELFDYFDKCIKDGDFSKCPRCENPHMHKLSSTHLECECGMQFDGACAESSGDITLRVGNCPGYLLCWEDRGKSCSIWSIREINRSYYDYISEIDGSMIDIKILDIDYIRKLLMLS